MLLRGFVKLDHAAVQLTVELGEHKQAVKNAARVLSASRVPVGRLAKTQAPWPTPWMNSTRSTPPPLLGDRLADLERTDEQSVPCLAAAVRGQGECKCAFCDSHGQVRIAAALTSFYPFWQNGPIRVERQKNSACPSVTPTGQSTGRCPCPLASGSRDSTSPSAGRGAPALRRRRSSCGSPSCPS